MVFHTKVNVTVEGEPIERDIEITFMVDDIGIPPVNVLRTSEVIGGEQFRKTFNADWLWDAIGYVQQKRLDRLMLKAWSESKHEGMSLPEAITELGKLHDTLKGDAA